MATKKRADAAIASEAHVSTDAETLLMAALERGGDTSKAGRFLMTFKEGAMDAGIKHLESHRGLRLAHARDFKDQAVMLEEAGYADAVVFPDIHVALMGGAAAAERGLTADTSIAEDGPVLSIDPEYFVFANGINVADYMKGVVRTAEMIARDLSAGVGAEEEITPEVLGVTWGLTACKAPPSTRDGNGIKVAVLDDGFDLGHPEFAGRSFTTATFVGSPITGLSGHGTHVAGTACGPKAPAGPIRRYGIGFRTRIFIDVFSSWPRPLLHRTLSGTSSSAAHVAGCAALWAQTGPSLRGAALRAKLFATARHLPFPATAVGAGLVQAPA